MYPKILLVASLAVAAIANNAKIRVDNEDDHGFINVPAVIDTTFDFDSTLDQDEPTTIVIVPPPASETTTEPTAPCTMGYPCDKSKRQTTQVPQQAVSASLPQATTTGRISSTNASLKYLPNPGPIPTTLPHYSPDSAAQLRSRISANKAKDSASDKVTSLSPWESQAWVDLISEIQTLQKMSASVSTVIERESLEMNVLQVEYDFITSRLTDREEKLEAKLHPRSGVVKAANSPTLMLTVAMSCVAAFGLAVVAFIV